MRFALRNPVLLVLALAVVAACLVTGFLSEAPNRLVSGQPLALWQTTGRLAQAALVFLGTALLALPFVNPSRKTQLATIASAAASLLLLCFAAGHGASILMAVARPATRIGLGPAFWIAILCLALAIVDAVRRVEAGSIWRLSIVLGMIAALAAMAAFSVFDELSIMREYATRRDAFAAELARHAVLVLASGGAALAIGVPLGLVAARRPGFGDAIFATLNLLQTIPSIALFGLLIAPLSALAAAIPLLGSLGIGGIGPAPAITALALYALLPMVRNTHAAIIGIDRAVIDGARGLGLTAGQIFRHVELPLGLPTVLAGLRVMLVQTIGIAVVAALIGAGGLGTFVFQGIGQYATDLVLLGAIPAILLAIAADFSLTLALHLLSSRPAP